MRYLLMLLAGPEADLLATLDLNQTGVRNGNGHGGWGTTTIFESLLRCLDCDPDQLDEVSKLLHSLGTAQDGQALFPEGFAAIWAPIWAARQSLRGSNESKRNS